MQLERDGVARTVDAFHASNTSFATAIACDAFELHTVEHLLAALGGLGIRSGCRVVVTGGEELPILDGASLEYVRALVSLELPWTPPLLRVARKGRLEIDGSVYELAPSDRVQVTVDVNLPPSCTRSASWDGEPRTFSAEIAPARTFALESDVPELGRLGLARHVEPRSVIVVSRDALHGQGDVAPDEPARHKLLDLIRDAYLYGGPPRGELRVSRPGHARNHAAFVKALAMGLIVRSEDDA